MKRKSSDQRLIPVARLGQRATVRDALELIAGNSWSIAAVVDAENRLTGIVSAGDLRRSLLQGRPVSAPIETVMNREPICIVEHELGDHQAVNRVADMLKVRYGDASILYAFVPVVSKGHDLLGLLSLDTLLMAGKAPPTPSPRRTVLIVGGAGYIGSVLTRLLLAMGWQVRVLDKLLYTEDSLCGLEPKSFSLIKGDALNIDTLVQAIEDVDAVVYLAELVGDPACSLAPQTALKTNYLAVTAIAHLCSHLNINRFVYMSSCSVYGASKNPEALLTEESPLEPVSLYARTKCLAEQAILLVRNLPNPLFAPTILRLGTVFGHSFRPRFDLVVNTFVKNAWQNGVIEVMGGEQWRPNVHVSDVARAISATLEAPLEKVRGETFNVGGNAQNHTINELAELAREVFPGLKIVQRGHAVDKRNYRVDFSKIERTLGYKASVSVKQGMLELKTALEACGLSPDESRFSNMKRLEELNLK